MAVSPGKRIEERRKIKKQVSFREERVPKKSCSQKLCNLCKKHGGAHTTHDTGECRKFTKDGTLKPWFKPKGGKAKSNDHNFAQDMKEGFVKVTKAFKEDLKKARKEKKRKEQNRNSKSS